MSSIERTSISEQIVRALRREILSGVLPAGSRLPSEAELAQRFGTNRNTLREAIRSLEGQNLLSVRQGEGVTVRDFRQVGELSLLPLFLSESNDEDHGTILEDLLGLRRMVLGEAGALAARRRTDGDLDTLAKLCAVLGSTQGKTREHIVADLDFYRALVVAAHSLIHVWLFNTFERSYRSLLPLVEALWVVPDGYLPRMQELCAAIARHDEAAARSLLHTHFDLGDALAVSLARSVGPNNPESSSEEESR